MAYIMLPSNVCRRSEAEAAANLTGMLHTLADWPGRRPTLPISFCQSSLALTYSLLPSLPPHSLATIFTSMVQLGLKPHPQVLRAALTLCIGPQLNQFSSTNAYELLCAFAAWKAPPHALYSFLAVQALEGIGFGPEAANDMGQLELLPIVLAKLKVQVPEEDVEKALGVVQMAKEEIQTTGKKDIAKVWGALEYDISKNLIKQKAVRAEEEKAEEKVKQIEAAVENGFGKFEKVAAAWGRYKEAMQGGKWAEAVKGADAEWDAAIAKAGPMMVPERRRQQQSGGQTVAAAAAAAAVDVEGSDDGFEVSGIAADFDAAVAASSGRSSNSGGDGGSWGSGSSIGNADEASMRQLDQSVQDVSNTQPTVVEAEIVDGGDGGMEGEMGEEELERLLKEIMAAGGEGEEGEVTEEMVQQAHAMGLFGSGGEVGYVIVGEDEEGGEDEGWVGGGDVIDVEAKVVEVKGGQGIETGTAGAAGGGGGVVTAAEDGAAGAAGCGGGVFAAAEVGAAAATGPQAGAAATAAGGGAGGTRGDAAGGGGGRSGFSSSQTGGKTPAVAAAEAGLAAGVKEKGDKELEGKQLGGDSKQALLDLLDNIKQQQQQQLEELASGVVEAYVTTTASGGGGASAAPRAAASAATAPSPAGLDQFMLNPTDFLGTSSIGSGTSDAEEVHDLEPLECEDEREAGDEDADDDADLAGYEDAIAGLKQKLYEEAKRMGLNPAEADEMVNKMLSMDPEELMQGVKGMEEGLGGFGADGSAELGIEEGIGDMFEQFMAFRKGKEGMPGGSGPYGSSSSGSGLDQEIFTKMVKELMGGKPGAAGGNNSSSSGGSGAGSGLDKEVFAKMLEDLMAARPDGGGAAGVGGRDSSSRGGGGVGGGNSSSSSGQGSGIMDELMEAATRARDKVAADGAGSAGLRGSSSSSSSSGSRSSAGKGRAWGSWAGKGGKSVKWRDGKGGSGVGGGPSKGQSGGAGQGDNDDSSVLGL